MTIVVGIDLAGAPDYGTKRYNRVGLAALDQHLSVIDAAGGRFNDDEILRFVERQHPDVVAIDAPLSFPATGALREVDRILARRGFRPYPPLLPSIVALTKRGIALRAALEATVPRVIETYPGAAQDTLGLPRKHASRQQLATGLRHLGVHPLETLDSDVLDAVTASYVAHCYLTGAFEAIGPPHDVQVINPRPEALAPSHGTHPLRPIDPERRYHNYEGRFPPLTIGGTSVGLPPESSITHPKRITDTTLRDGAQDPRFALFPFEAKLRYVDLLHRLDNDTGRIEQIEVFIYQERDRHLLAQLLERGYRYPEITTWTRATPKDIRDLVDIAGGAITETGILASASDHHIFDKLGFRSKQEAIDKYLQPIVTAMEHGIRPRVHLEDCTRADIEGWVLPFMERVLVETGGQARFRICDTIGDAVPDPSVPSPLGVPALVSLLLRETGAELEFHGHNDFGLGTANSLAAWLYGCKRVNCAFAGLGERTGNTALEQMLALSIRLWGDPGLDLSALQEIAELIEREVVPLNEKQPVIGSTIFLTQAGLHQTGMERQKEAPGGLIYLPYAPELVGREAGELHRIGALSGMDGLVAVLNAEHQRRTGRPGPYSLTSRAVKRAYDTIQAAYDGEWDAAAGRPTNERRSFFDPGELWELAQR